MTTELDQLREAVREFIAVDDELVIEDYGDHSGMSNEDAGRWAQAVAKLTKAVG